MPLPKFDEYKAPWEIDSTGADIAEDEQQLDPAKLKKYLHGLLSDKEKLQTKNATLIGERDEIKTKYDELARKDETDTDKVKRERDEAIQAAKAEGSLEALKLDVALDIEGVSAKEAKTLAKRLSGTTREELEADAKELVEVLGLGKKAGDEGDEGDEPEVTPGSRPRRPVAAGDPKPLANTKVVDLDDPDAVAKLFPR